MTAVNKLSALLVSPNFGNFHSLESLSVGMGRQQKGLGVPPQAGMGWGEEGQVEEVYGIRGTFQKHLKVKPKPRVLSVSPAYCLAIPSASLGFDTF